MTQVTDEVNVPQMNFVIDTKMNLSAEVTVCDILIFEFYDFKCTEQ